MEVGTNILLISFAVSVVLGLIIIPILKKLKVGQIERDDGPQSHLKKQGTPTMGRNNYYTYNDTCSCRFIYFFNS